MSTGVVMRCWNDDVRVAGDSQDVDPVVLPRHEPEDDGDAESQDDVAADVGPQHEGVDDVAGEVVLVVHGVAQSKLNEELG